VLCNSYLAALKKIENRYDAGFDELTNENLPAAEKSEITRQIEANWTAEWNVFHTVESLPHQSPAGTDEGQDS
jgi:hypothetical protein